MKANEWLLETALKMYNSMLNQKVIEQYLTEQPRWSSDVIKALHQEALLLGAVSRLFPLFSYASGNRPHRSDFKSFQRIRTCIN